MDRIPEVVGLGTNTGEVVSLVGWAKHDPLLEVCYALSHLYFSFTIMDHIVTG